MVGNKLLYVKNLLDFLGCILIGLLMHVKYFKYIICIVMKECDLVHFLSFINFHSFHSLYSHINDLQNGQPHTCKCNVQ